MASNTWVNLLVLSSPIGPFASEFNRNALLLYALFTLPHDFRRFSSNFIKKCGIAVPSLRTAFSGFIPCFNPVTCTLRQV